MPVSCVAGVHETSSSPRCGWRNTYPQAKFEAPSPFMPVTLLPPDLAEALRDRYVLQRELGHGGMATVYLARDIRHKRLVALKVLHPELGAVLGTERFLREVETEAGLQHPHILPVFDSGEAAGTAFTQAPASPHRGGEQSLAAGRQCRRAAAAAYGGSSAEMTRSRRAKETSLVTAGAELG